MKKIFTLKAAFSTLVVVGLTACGGSSKKSDTPTAQQPETEQPAVDAPVDNDITLAGSLNLLGGSSSASLTLVAAGTYDVYCVTFEDDPKACKAEIDTTGNFDKTCEDYAGASFGCFLRKDNKTVGDIQFDLGTDEDESSLVAGAGKIEVKINFDADLGVATAVVDTTASSALAADKVAAVKAASGKVNTELGNLTGNYALEVLGFIDDEGKLQQIPEDAGGGKGGGGGAPESIFLNEFDDGGVRKVSIWNSEAAKNLCLTGGSEQYPAFGAQIGTNPRISLKPENLKAYRDSMGQVVGQFAAAHPVAFKNLISATSGQWEAQRCEEQEKNAQNASDSFNTNNCKIVSPSNREVRYYDPGQQKEVVRYEPEWFNSWADVQAAPAIGDANIVKGTFTCFNPLVGKPSGDNKFMPPCPPDWNEANETLATGTFTNFEYVNGTERRPAQFLCKNPQDTAGGVMFLPITEKDPTCSSNLGDCTLNASIANVKTQFSNGGGTDASCDKITVAAMFDPNGTIGIQTSDSTLAQTEVYKSQRRVLLQTFGNLLRESDSDHKDEMCSQWKKPTDLSNWTFAANCSQDGQQNGPQPSICFQKDWVLGALGLTVNQTGNGFVAQEQGGGRGPQGPWLPPEAKKLCPTVSASFSGDEPTQADRNASPETGGFQPFEQRKSTEKASCKTEFLGLPNFPAQLSRLFDASLDPKNQPPEVSLQCSQDTSTATAVASLAANSCIPDVQIDFRCEGGKECTEVLRCWGTEDGSCVDATGKIFQGRVPNRFEQTTLRLGTDGAFNMSSLTTETWSQWSEKGEKICKAARGFKIQAIKKSDTSFEGLLNSTEKQKCDGDTEETEGSDGGPDKMQLRFTKI